MNIVLLAVGLLLLFLLCRSVRDQIRFAASTQSREV